METVLFVETEYLRVLGSATAELRMGRKQPSGPEVVCLADELASARAIMKSLCALNKSAGIGPAALASVGLGLDNQDCRIKTRGRNTGVILLARIPSALLACLPQSGGGESESREREREMAVGEGQSAAPQATTMWRQSKAALYAGQLCSDQHSLRRPHARIHKSKICLCLKIKPLNPLRLAKGGSYPRSLLLFKHYHT